MTSIQGHGTRRPTPREARPPESYPLWWNLTRDGQGLDATLTPVIFFNKRPVQLISWGFLRTLTGVPNLPLNLGTSGYNSTAKKHHFRNASEILRRRRWFFAQYCDRRRNLVSPFRPWNKAAEYGMASFGFTNKETKDSAISYEDLGHCLLECRGVHVDWISGTWESHKCFSCPDTKQALLCIAR